MGSNTVFKNAPVIDHGDVLILSVKPQVVPKVLPEFRIHDNKKLLISIAMGVSLASLEKVIHFCHRARIHCLLRAIHKEKEQCIILEKKYF